LKQTAVSDTERARVYLPVGYG